MPPLVGAGPSTHSPEYVLQWVPWPHWSSVEQTGMHMPAAVLVAPAQL